MITMLSEEAPRTGETVERAVSLRGLTKSFGSNHAVRGLDLEIERGSTVALLGPNGAGKSTTISMLLGLLEPDRGEVRILGKSPRRAVAEGLIGAMQQDAGLMQGVRVGELLDMVRHLYQRPLPMVELIESAGLESLLGRRADRLSGGQAQRLRFAMALAGDPSIIVLDEPTSAMDVDARHAFWRRMERLAEAGRTILFATHYLEEADAAADRVVVVAQGRVIADGSPAQIKSRLGQRRIRLTSPEAAERLEGLAAVSRVERTGRQVTLFTADADATVRDLIGLGLAWRDIEIGGVDLEDAFISLTGEVR
ncbi:MAG TPA: ABC transporter ATP-binding protein [Candidatus Dormibacteraeota bacterium]|jgi:ABC-2 type transport system ATP-binding protein|nr:ABC transporter ATP-binding protein [Candidatus Dormibacteraeota bacterium]